MKLQTERLELIPLLPYQLRLWIEDIAALERDLKCFYKAEPMAGCFLEVVKGQLDITEKNPSDYLWHSFGFLIRQVDRVIVGSADFKNIPDDKQEVEIGYGLSKEFEKNGYMTEAVQAMCEWALKQEHVAHINAETDKAGFASQHILQHCGFVEERRGESVWWKL